ncbi:MAG: pyridoxal 5'-phosphate synthase glutaminase subunit PdxT [Nocardioides sp.]
MTSRVPTPQIGVLALQGDVREHVAALASLGVVAHPVRRPGELADVDALVLPGGESTTMVKLARTFEMLEPLRQRIKDGMPAFGTCAGMILLADRIEDGTADQESVGGLDITVRRNAFGRQVDSFEGPIDIVGLAAPVHGVFIRAPWVEEVGPGVEVLARVGTSPVAGRAAGRIVAVRQGPLMATSFHPEVGEDPRVHEMFVQMVVRHLAGDSS